MEEGGRDWAEHCHAGKAAISKALLKCAAVNSRYGWLWSFKQVKTLDERKWSKC